LASTIVSFAKDILGMHGKAVLQSRYTLYEM